MAPVTGSCRVAPALPDPGTGLLSVFMLFSFARIMFTVELFHISFIDLEYS